MFNEIMIFTQINLPHLDHFYEIMYSYLGNKFKSHVGGIF